jgi:2-polyprenyl-6-methoxyphenol hydroxylase-like FAD-dependent oxidoreductase
MRWRGQSAPKEQPSSLVFVENIRGTIRRHRLTIHKAVVDTTLKEDAGNFLFLNAETCETRYKIPPSKRRLRLHRQKLRGVLADGLNVQENKKLLRVEEIEGGVRAHFEDGTFADGTILVGTDGNNSNVRKFLMPEDYKLNMLPVHLVGVIRHFTPGRYPILLA